MNKAKRYALAAWVIAAIMLGATWAQQSSSTSITVSAGGVAAGLANVTPVSGDVVLYTYHADEDGDGNDGYYITEGSVGQVAAEGTTMDEDDTDASKNGTKTVNNIIYKIQTADTGRYMITIFLTNVDELVEAYSYLNLNITIYNSDSSWTKGTKVTSEWITLTNGRVVLYVEGKNYYLVKIPDGVFYCIETTGVTLVPSFYIMVDQA